MIEVRKVQLEEIVVALRQLSPLGCEHGIETPGKLWSSPTPQLATLRFGYSSKLIPISASKNVGGSEQLTMTGQYHKQDSNNYHLKAEIHEFKGDLHVEDFLDRVFGVERVANVIGISGKLIKLAAYKLKEGAVVWWGQLQKNRL